MSFLNTFLSYFVCCYLDNLFTPIFTLYLICVFNIILCLQCSCQQELFDSMLLGYIFEQDIL